MRLQMLALLWTEERQGKTERHTKTKNKIKRKAPRKESESPKKK